MSTSNKTHQSTPAPISEQMFWHQSRIFNENINLSQKLALPSKHGVAKPPLFYANPNVYGNLADRINNSTNVNAQDTTIYITHLMLLKTHLEPLFVDIATGYRLIQMR